MVDFITVDSELADGVEKEIYSPLKCRWQYYSLTTDFYNTHATQTEKENIDYLSKVYGPVVDTQRFTYTIFLRNSEKDLFFKIRSDPNSAYRKNFTFLPNLVDQLQQFYIPRDYVVDRLIINMQTIRPTWSMNAIHPDARKEQSITILYYVNNSDGDTYFFNDRECIRTAKPIKGTAAIYPSSTLHAGSTPIKHETRTVINMVFKQK